MSSAQIFCLLVCTSLAAARTINLEKISVSITEESKDTDSVVKEILTSVLNYHGNPSGGLEFDIQDCSNGTCKFCKAKSGFEACFIASVGTGSINMEITINGKTFFQTTLSVAGDKTICKDVDFIPDVTQVCMIFTQINLKDMSGCVEISVKTKLLPLNFMFGCFKIPHNERKLTGSVDFQLGTQNEAKTTDAVLKYNH